MGIVVLCSAILAPTIGDKEALPSWFPFKRKISLGLDLQGGLHIVYSIDLDKAIDDRASQIRNDLESAFKEEPPVQATVKTPISPPGAVTVTLQDPTKKEAVREQIEKLYPSENNRNQIDWLTSCPDQKELDAINTRISESTDENQKKQFQAQADELKKQIDASLCFKVGSGYADNIKKSALANAVATIRERIDEKGVAEPTVVEKDEQIIVELPGLDKDVIAETKDLIARTAKLEFKVVDNGSQYMQNLFRFVGSKGKTGEATEERAAKDKIYAEIDHWRPEEGQQQVDWFLLARDRKEKLSEAEARDINCIKKNDKVGKDYQLDADGKVECQVEGKHVLERYFKYLTELAEKNPAMSQLKVPDDRQIGYELVEPQKDAKDPTKYWRTYYLNRTVELTGAAINNAQGSIDPSTQRPVVLLDFNRYGSRVFGDLTARIVGKKLATILDEKVKSAPIINTAIRGGKASITMGGSDVQRQEREREELVNVLKTGSLPAPLREESASELGPTLGQDAIDKTKLSFAVGIALVIVIMVGIYRWSGWIAVFAVIWHIVMTLAVMALFGATLTLPGIAAIVLSIGMEVDGNILIYERIRDELLLGKSVRGAIDLGFSRAFSAILDGQLTTAAAGWVLLQYGSGPIKGFAVMLLVGVFTTLSTNVWVTRIFFDWYVAKKKGTMATISI